MSGRVGIVASCGCVAFVDGSGEPCAEHHPDSRGEQIGEPRCPYCDRVMSRRESAEQGSCNDCFGGAWSPSGEEVGRGW